MLLPRSPIFVATEPSQVTNACVSCEVRNGALFGVLDDAALSDVHQSIGTGHLDPGQLLYRRGAAGPAVFTIRSGIVRLERVTEGGDRRIVRLAGPGDFIGQEALLGREYTDDAVACTDVAACRIPRPLIEELGVRQPPLQRALMERWQRALEDAEAWGTELTVGPARSRVLRLLARLRRLSGDHPTLWLPTREQIGDMLHMAEETASRQISDLRRAGVIEPLPGQRARLDTARLADELESANCAGDNPPCFRG